MHRAGDDYRVHEREIHALTGAEGPEVPIACFHCEHEPMRAADLLVLPSHGDEFLSGACGCSVLCYRVVGAEEPFIIGAGVAGQDRA